MTQQDTSREFVKAPYNQFLMLGGDITKWDNETSARVNQYCEELQTKRNYTKFTKFPATSDDMIIGNHLRMYSICEHHLLPFFGEAAIAYIPDKWIFGLSKFQRIIDMVASRPQLQERLTHEILKFIDNAIQPKGIAVQIKAIHTCVFARGVQSTDAQFTTTAVSGRLKVNPQARNEFLQNVNADGRFRI
jgi:GTP cyclohydrolase IA